MKFSARVLSYWESMRESYWFVPCVMAIGATLFGFFIVRFEYYLPSHFFDKLSWLYSGTPSGARTLLATIASSMIGLAGVVFSITIVALTLASGQFGARLLRNFMRDRGNQITLGTFLANFLYCLVILRAIEDSSGSEGALFVPQFSIFVAFMMAVAGLGVLIFFIHHVASSIQAPNVIASVAKELNETVENLYPTPIGDNQVSQSEEQSGLAQLSQFLPENAKPIPSKIEGYIQRIEPEMLISLCKKHDLIVRVEKRPGQFIYAQDAVLLAWPTKHVTTEVLEELIGTFSLGNSRSLAQDAEFAVEQLVEVAVRALSPGINDPFTAVQCVERLGAALSYLALKENPSQYRLDDDGKLRMIAAPRDFSHFIDTAFNQIRAYAGDSVNTLLSLLNALEKIAAKVIRENDMKAVLVHSEMVYDKASEAIKTPADRQKINEAFDRIKRLLEMRF